MSLTIQKATPADPEAMAAIERECFSDPWSRSSFEQMTSLAVARTLTAWLEEAGERRLVGYLIALVIPPEAEIANIAVAPDCRRMGIGAALLAEGMHQMEGEGCDSFFLEVRESNLAAQSLYERLGFVVTGRRRHYYQNPCEDALLMAYLPQ